MLAACKPPPTDADMLRDMPEAAPTFASAPLPSPDTEGAKWVAAPLDDRDRRIVYGVPGQPVLLVLECFFPLGEVPNLTLTRLAPADKGAGALLAMVGNGHIGRLPVEARGMEEPQFWEGERPAGNGVWEPIAGPREATLTVPGAGMIRLNPSPLPRQLREACWSGEEFVPISQASPEDKAADETKAESDPPARSAFPG